MNYLHLISVFLVLALLGVVFFIERRGGHHALAAGTCLFAGFTGYSAVPVGFGLQISFLLAALLLLLQFQRESNISQPSGWIIAWLCIALASSVMSYTIPGEVDGMQPWLKSLKQSVAHCSYVVCCCGVYNYARKSGSVDKILGYLLCGGVLAAGIGLLQPVVVGQGWYDLADLFWNNPSYGGVVAKQQGIIPLHVAKSTLGVIRIWGPAMEPNYLGSFLSFVLLSSLGLIVGGHVPARVRLLSRLGCIICLAGLILTQSRGAILSLAIGVTGFIFSLANPARLLKRLAAGVVILACSSAILIMFASAAGSDPIDMANERFRFLANEDNFYSDYSAGARLAAFRIAVDMASDYPLLGVGIGNYGFHVYDYLRSEYQYREFRSGEWHVPFGWPATALSETGLLGSLMFLGILFVTARAGVQLKHSPASRHVTGAFWGFVALTVDGIAGSQVNTPVWWIAIGLLLGARDSLAILKQPRHNYDIQLSPSPQYRQCELPL